MLEAMREQLMDWFAIRRNSEDRTQGIIVAKMAKKILSLQEFGRRYRARMSTATRYEVDSVETLKTYPVNLQNHTCTCGEWQAQGFPCAHAIRAILTRNENPQNYAESFYTLDAYKSTYAGAIMHPETAQLDSEPPEFDGNQYKGVQIVIDGEGDDESKYEGESESESESEDALIPPST